MTLRRHHRFTHRLRVRWAEVDAQRIVFNGHYLMYFDTAMGEYWRALGLPYESAMARLGGDLYVRKTTLDYHASARYDELLDIHVRCEHIGNTSMRMHCEAYRADTLLVSGELVYVFADPQTQQSRPIPTSLRDLVLDFEAGAEMLDIQVGPWPQLGLSAREVREEVFVREQGIPKDLELDEADQTAVHALVINHLGMPLATGRLTRLEPGVSRMGRMAVVASMRGSSVGSRVVRALLQAAHDQGDHTVLLHAQQSAVPFYRRFGFVETGPHHEEAGIVHMTMVRRLDDLSAGRGSPVLSGGPA